MTHKKLFQPLLLAAAAALALPALAQNITVVNFGGANGADGQVKPTEQDHHQHAAGDDADDRLLLDDIHWIVDRAKTRRDHRQTANEQGEDDQ